MYCLYLIGKRILIIFHTLSLNDRKVYMFRDPFENQCFDTFNISSIFVAGVIKHEV